MKKITIFFLVTFLSSTYLGCWSSSDNSVSDSKLKCKSCIYSDNCVDGICLPKKCDISTECQRDSKNFICAYDFDLGHPTCRAQKPGECLSSTDCKSSEVCDRGKCYPNCTTSASCSHTYKCDSFLKRCVCVKSLCKEVGVSGCRPDSRLCSIFCTPSETVPVCGENGTCKTADYGPYRGFCVR